MTAPEQWPPVAPPQDPVEFWLQRARCCGAPQHCGAVCMDDERSQTEAAVVRRLDDAEAKLALARRWAVRVGQEEGAHHSVQVFVGQPGSRALAGVLTLRADEATDLLLILGAAGEES